MNIAEYSLKNKKVVFFFLAVLLIGGVYSFFLLPKKEDSPFIIKTAVLITNYPGATPAEVELLITEPIEREVQSMSEVKQVKSESYYGMSKITVDLDPTITPERMPLKWDELRRKVANIQPRLPAGASNIFVNDDFGDVFGIYYALVAQDGISDSYMRHFAQQIKRDLTPIKGVQKVALFAEQQEVVYVDIALERLAVLGLDPNSIKQVIQTQNLLINTGEINAGKYMVKISPDGTYQSVDDIANQLIITRNRGEVRLGDIANVYKGYADRPSYLMRVNGKRAIGIGVATGAKDNVVAVGNSVDAQLRIIEESLPAGLSLIALYPEHIIANEANNGFIINLIVSLLIVIFVIFIVMGYRAGLLIGSSLIFSVGGTLLIMLLFDVGLNRTSLAAFIIAMGMLVDNAIVVTDNAQIAIMRGSKRFKALIDAATKPQWALLGATFIAVCSFLPMYLAPASVAEIVKPLFIVLAVSLGLSWVLALSQTTTFGDFILKESSTDSQIEPYSSGFYKKFATFLTLLIKRRYLTIISVVATLILSLVVMGLMPQSFFPVMDKPYFRADLIFPEGFDIREVEQNVIDIEDYLSKNDKIKNYSITIGGAPIRYYLASSSAGPLSNFANILIELNSSDYTVEQENEFYWYMRNNYPDILTRSSLFALSPVPAASIEIGFRGPNIDTLSLLTQKASEIARSDKSVMDIRNSWGAQVPIVVPEFSQEKGLRLGITRQQFAYAIKLVSNGVPLGEYREGDLFMPILLKGQDLSNMNLNDIKSVPVYSSKGKSVKLEQVAKDIDLKYEYSVIKRYNRERLMLMQADPVRGGNTIAAFGSLYSKIKENIELPQGYSLSYFGEQDSREEGNSAIGKNVPLMFGLIYVALLLLFPKNYRKPILIMSMLPLMFIGVVLGLLVFGKSLDFFAMLGLLGLIGMNIKNAIVLVDEIGAQRADGKEEMDAIVDATKSRIIPVVMASGTTILGMFPLVFDAMFGGMAATIIGGLFVSTILTILVLPVAYAAFFRVKVQNQTKGNGVNSVKKGITLLVIGAALSIYPYNALAQESREELPLEQFVERVLEYNHDVKSAHSKRIAFEQAAKLAYTSFFPSVLANANFSYALDHSTLNIANNVMDLNRESYSVEGVVSLPIYSGGQISNRYKIAQLSSEIGNEQLNLTTRDVMYYARVAYLSASAQKENYKLICRFEQIVDTLYAVLSDRFNEGLISRTELLQISARQKDVQLQKINVYKSYKIALQNLNVMIGHDPFAPIDVADLDNLFNQMPMAVDLKSAIVNRPEFKISQLNVDSQNYQISLARGLYNPKLSIGAKLNWGTKMINLSGDTQFNPLMFASLSVPIFNFGARYRSVDYQRALLKSYEYSKMSLQDNILKEIAQAWTSMIENTNMIGIAIDNCDIAQRNLDLNTFSYTEGNLTILDVLSAQITWVQSYSGLIQAMYNQKMSVIDYSKAAAIDL